MSGVKVPKLGSFQDRAARKYLLQKSDKEIAFARMIAHIAASNKPGDQVWNKEISSMYSNYINLALYLDSSEDSRAEEMQKDFEYWKTVRPIATVSKDGNISIKGIV